jgi:uncharacterized membrane protein
MAGQKSGVVASLTGFLKATIVGGILFLLPLVLIVIVLGHAMRIAAKVAEPISKLLPIETTNPAAIVTFLAVFLLVVISLIAGLIARTNPGRRLMRWFEDSLFGELPQYQMVKSVAEGLAQIEGAEGLTPALVSIEDGWQIGYLLEPVNSGWVAVFLPQAPTPMSGNIMYLPAERVKPLELTMVQAMALVKRIGVGSGKVLGGVDLSLPARS